jgi:predicted phosphoribosyltransferase
MVYYGQDVFPTLKPGQSLSEVTVYTAPDGTEKFNKAFKALDGSLNLLHGTGARLLVVVSDGCYTGEEIEKAKRWIRRCHETGVAVLWLPMGPRDYYAEDIIRGTDAVMLADVNDPAKAALEIGRAAAKALEKVTSRTAA